MNITLEHTVDPREWDDLAMKMGGGYHHCHAAILADALNENGVPLFVKAHNENRECVGIAACTVAQSRIWPFSRYCKYAMISALPAMRNSAAAGQIEFLKNLEEHLRREGVFKIRVSSYDSPQSEEVLSHLGYTVTKRWEFYVDLRKSLDEIWMSFSRSRRKDIRKAEKMGVVSKMEYTMEAARQALSFHDQSMQRREVFSRSKERTSAQAIQNLFDNNRIEVWTTCYKGKAVDGVIFGFFNNKAFGLIGGSSPEAIPCYAASYRMWSSIRYYKEKGMREINYGGAKEDEEGGHLFKRQFGAIIIPQPVGEKYISRTGARLYNIRSLLKPSKKTTPLIPPAYRADPAPGESSA